jgi:hypothetical protein
VEEEVSHRYIKRPRPEPTSEDFVALAIVLGPLAWPVRWAWRKLRALCALALIAAVLGGCGASIAIMRNARTGHQVECHENLWDGIPNTLGRCIRAYEQAGYEVIGRQ